MRVKSTSSLATVSSVGSEKTRAEWDPPAMPIKEQTWERCHRWRSIIKNWLLNYLLRNQLTKSSTLNANTKFKVSTKVEFHVKYRKSLKILICWYIELTWGNLLIKVDLSINRMGLDFYPRSQAVTIILATIRVIGQLRGPLIILEPLESILQRCSNSYRTILPRNH